MSCMAVVRRTIDPRTRTMAYSSIEIHQFGFWGSSPAEVYTPLRPTDSGKNKEVLFYNAMDNPDDLDVAAKSFGIQKNTSKFGRFWIRSPAVIQKQKTKCATSIVVCLQNAGMEHVGC